MPSLSLQGAGSMVDLTFVCRLLPGLGGSSLCRKIGPGMGLFVEASKRPLNTSSLHEAGEIHANHEARTVKICAFAVLLKLNGSFCMHNDPTTRCDNTKDIAHVTREPSSALCSFQGPKRCLIYGP